jgi:hypothetical protein
VRQEFAVLTAPWLASPDWSLDWELVGGDEVDGRVAGVVRRRGPTPGSAEQARLEASWLFDWETGRLLRARFGDSDQPDRVVWTPLAWMQRDGLVWGPRWRRQCGESDVRVEWMSAADAATARRPAATSASSSGAPE